MRVKLVDVDLKYREKKRRGCPPINLALAKVSAFHKAHGDLVGFNIENPDMTYISCVFTRNRLNGIWEVLNSTENRSFGGSGIWLEEILPDEIEYLKPDYNIYPHWLIDKRGQSSVGFTSRGCIRKCEFCIVHDKEGAYHRVQHVKEFYDDRFKKVMLLDNNILSDKEWFFENTDWIIDHKLKLNISQGMDIRLLTDEISEQLHRIKFVDQQMRFAWDKMYLEERVKAGIEMLKDHKINVRNVSFFVLSGYNTTFCQDLYRCNKLKSFGAMPYVMPYEDGTPMIRALARWGNRRELFWKIPFYQYDRMPTPP
jgi:hypothetical protein